MGNRGCVQSVIEVENCSFLNLRVSEVYVFNQSDEKPSYQLFSDTPRSP